MSLQKHRTTQPIPSLTSLSTVKDRVKPQLGQISEGEVDKLFGAGQREVFEMDYLYNSPHFSDCSSYRDIVQLLEHYNEEATSYNLAQSVLERPDDPSPVKLASLKFLYREMLYIARKERWEIKESEIDTKLKNWYYGLNEMRSFLQGVNIKKKDKGQEWKKEEDLIRASYTSNVFDEIDDYFRRKIDVPPPSKPLEEVKVNKLRREEVKIDCNLPLIDKLIYKREDTRMRNHREKEFDTCFLSTMTSNRNHMRGASLQKFRNKYNIREAPSNSGHKSLKFQKSQNFVTMPNSFLSKTSFGGPSSKVLPDKENRLGKLKISDSKRPSLSSITGMSLIMNQYE